MRTHKFDNLQKENNCYISSFNMLFHSCAAIYDHSPSAIRTTTKSSYFSFYSSHTPLNFKRRGVKWNKAFNGQETILYHIKHKFFIRERSPRFHFQTASEFERKICTIFSSCQKKMHSVKWFFCKSLCVFKILHKI